jgi:6-pyruvoyl-tetrahydropterin synthase
VPVALTRGVEFFALHRYYRADRSEQENAAEFGELAAPAGHGHNYRCLVTVEGPLDAAGMIIDLPLLDRILASEVTGPLTGRRLDLVIPEFSTGSPLPTCEALADHLYSRIAGRLPGGVTLTRLRIMEDETLFADRTPDG